MATKVARKKVKLFRNVKTSKTAETVRRKSPSDDLLVIKRQLADSLRHKMDRDHVNISKLAKEIGTGRTAIRRVLDKKNTSITLRTMHRTAKALGMRLVLEVQPMAPKALGVLATRMADASTEQEAQRLKEEITRGFYGDASSSA